MSSPWAASYRLLSPALLIQLAHEHGSEVWYGYGSPENRRLLAYIEQGGNTGEGEVRPQYERGEKQTQEAGVNKCRSGSWRTEARSSYRGMPEGASCGDMRGCWAGKLTAGLEKRGRCDAFAPLVLPGRGIRALDGARAVEDAAREGRVASVIMATGGCAGGVVEKPRARAKGTSEQEAAKPEEKMVPS
ncbi:hypothetical protein DFH09DRAFT_1069623 [Mycena vulgaris]|nr:hypothetical protein DFH09DRAFT_1069623 [Mycena vulgaris]